MTLNPGPLGLEERTDIGDLWHLWSITSEGPRKAGLMARIRRHPDHSEPDPTPGPPEPVAVPPVPGDEPTATRLDAQLSAAITNRRIRPVDNERAWTEVERFSRSTR